MGNLNGIKLARQKKNMTQLDLARQLDVDIETIQRWEKGMGSLSYKHFTLLIKVLDVSANMILFGESRHPINVEDLSEIDRKIVIQLYERMLDGK